MLSCRHMLLLHRSTTGGQSCSQAFRWRPQVLELLLSIDTLLRILKALLCCSRCVVIPVTYLSMDHVYVAGFPEGAPLPNVLNQLHHLSASHQGGSLAQLASIAIDNPMSSEGLIDASAGELSSCSTSQCYVMVTYYVHNTLLYGRVCRVHVRPSDNQQLFCCQACAVARIGVNAT